jgi:hypothetical protein
MLPLIIEMLIKLQASINVTAKTVCDLQVSGMAASRNVEPREDDREKLVDIFYQEYWERVSEEELKYGFTLGERFPLLPQTDSAPDDEK